MSAQPSMQKLKKIKARQDKLRSEKGATNQPTAAAVGAANLGNEAPLWYSPDGTEIRVCLPDGRVAIVGEVPRELPRSFYRDAAKAGCLSTTQIKPSDYNIPTTPDHADPEKRTLAVRKLILEAATANEDDPDYAGAFTPAGLPNVLWLSKRLGFLVEKTERDSAWNQIKAEIDTETEGDDNDLEERDNA